MNIEIIVKTQELLARSRARRERATRDRMELERRAAIIAARPLYVLKNKQFSLKLDS